MNTYTPRQTGKAFSNLVMLKTNTKRLVLQHNIDSEELMEKFLLGGHRQSVKVPGAMLNILVYEKTAYIINMEE